MINFALLSLAVFGHFDTFLDGWVMGGRVEGKLSIKTNSAKLKLMLRLSLAISEEIKFFGEFMFDY